MEVVDINIVATSTKNPKSLLKRSYTNYHIKVNTSSTQFILKKRYSEFLALKEKIPQSRPLDFPPKSLRSMSTAVVLERKIVLEKWLKTLVKDKIQNEAISGFLKLKEFEVKFDYTPDEMLVQQFTEDLKANPQRKIAFLDKFSKDFFLRRRVISSDVAERLFENLIPLCSDWSCLGKPLEIISKLLDRDFYRFHDFMSKILTELPLRLIQNLNLKDYLKKKISSDNQLRAYNLIKLLQSSDKPVELILENDEEALRIFMNWGVCAEETKFRKLSRSELVTVLDDKNLNISYKTQDKSIQVIGYFEVCSTIERVVELISSPFDRKQWDLRLEHMFEDDPVYKMYYEIDQKKYEFDAEVEVSEGETSACVKVRAELTCCPYSDFVAEYKVEKIYSNDTECIKGKGKIRCNWESEYRGKANKLVVYDLIGEENLLVNSFRLLSEMCQKRDSSFISTHKRFSFNEAAHRKYLPVRQK